MYPKQLGKFYYWFISMFHIICMKLGQWENIYQLKLLNMPVSQ